jgi:hypothetical protein
MVSLLGSPEGFTQEGGITLAPSVQHDCLHYAGLLLQAVVVVVACVVDVEADCPCAWWITSLLGTPRGRYDEYSS